MNAALTEALRLQKAGDLDASEALCREVLQEEPHCLDALHLLGLACRRAEKLDDAIAAFEQAALLQPENPLYSFELGATNSLRGELDQAFDWYCRAIALKPDFQEA